MQTWSPVNYTLLVAHNTTRNKTWNYLCWKRYDVVETGVTHTTALEAVRLNISGVTDWVIVKVLVDSMRCMRTKFCPLLIFYRLFQQPATSANNITKDIAQPMHCAHNLQILFRIINFHTHDKGTDHVAQWFGIQQLLCD